MPHPAIQNPPPSSSHRLLELFSVPMLIVEGAVDGETNAAASAWIEGERLRDSGVRRSLVGGWHSRPDLPARGVPALDALLGTMLEQVRGLHGHLARDAEGLRIRFLTQAWATVMTAGHYVLVHDHADTHWSAVYYVDAGDCDDPASGRISWINPIGSHRSLPGIDVVPTSFTCTPRTGLLVVFPGWLRHSVEPYQGHRPRIVVAMNVEVQRLSG